MSHSLTVELSDSAYAELVQRAECTEQSPVDVATAALESHLRTNVASDAKRQAARERFERHFGAMDLGRPTGSDNESIDADLAREYGERHEGS